MIPTTTYYYLLLPTTTYYYLLLPMLGDFGATLGLCWAILGPSWAYVGPSWDHRGPMLHLGAIVGLYVGPWGHFGAILGQGYPQNSWLCLCSFFRAKNTVNFGTEQGGS